MAKQAQRQAPKQQPRLDILFIGLICLGIGATVGYYLGRQSVRTDLPPTDAAPSAGSKSSSTEDVEKLLERLKQKQ